MTRYSSIAVCTLACLSSSMAYGILDGERSRTRELFDYLAPNAFRNEAILNKISYEETLSQDTRNACRADANICRPPPIVTTPTTNDPLALLLTPPNPTMGGSPAILNELLGIAPPLVSAPSAPWEEGLLRMAPPLEDERQMKQDNVNMDPVGDFVDDIMGVVLNLAMMMPPPSTDMSPTSEIIITNMDSPEEVFDTFIISFLSHSAAAEEAIASSDEPQAAIAGPCATIYDPTALTQKINEKGQDLLEQVQEESASRDVTEDGDYYDEYYNLKETLARRLTQVDGFAPPLPRRRLQAMPEDEGVVIFSFIEQPLPPVHIGLEPFVEECLWHKHAFNLLGSGMCHEYLDTVLAYLEQGTVVVSEPLSMREKLMLLNKDRRTQATVLLPLMFLSIFGLVYGFFSLMQDICEDKDGDEEEEEDCATCLASVLCNVILVVMSVGYFVMCANYTDMNSMLFMGVPAFFVVWSICGCLESCLCGDDDDEEENDTDEVYVLIQNTYPGSMAMEERNRGNKEAYEGVPVSMPIQII